MRYFKEFCDASQSPLWMILTMIFPHPLLVRISPNIIEKGDGQVFPLFETITLPVAIEF